MNEIYIINGKKYDVSPDRKEEFLTQFPGAEIFTQEAGKTSTTEKDTTVDAIEVSESTESPLEPGSSGLTAYKDLTDEQKKQLNKQKKVDLGNSPEEIAKRRKISRAEQADILSTDIELDEVVLVAGNEVEETIDPTAKGFIDSIKNVTKDNSKTAIATNYFNLKQGIGKMEGILEPNIGKRPQRFKKLPDGRDSGTPEYVNSYDTDLKNALGEEKYEKWIKLRDSSDEPVTADFLQNKLDLKDIPANVVASTVQKEKYSAAESYINEKDLNEAEQDALRFYLPGDQEFKDDLANIVIQRKQDQLDFEAKFGRPLLRTETIQGRTYIYGTDKPIQKAIEDQDKRLLQEFKSIESEAENLFEVDIKNYENELLSLDDSIEQRQVLIAKSTPKTQEELDDLNSKIETLNLDIEKRNLYSKNTIESLNNKRLELNKRSDILTSLIPETGLTKTANKAIQKSYALDNQFSLVMEEAFLGSGAMLAASTLKGIGDVVQFVDKSMFQREGAGDIISEDTVKQLADLKGAAVNYNQKLRQTKQEVLPETLGEDDDGYWGRMLVDNSPSILTAIATMGAGSLGVAGARAAANAATAVFFTMETGGRTADLEIQQRNAPKVISALEAELEQTKGDFEVNRIKEEIAEQKNILNKAQWQKSLNSVLYGGIAAGAERFGTLGFIKNFQKYSKAIGYNQFRKVANIGISKTLSKSLGAIGGIGVGVAIEELEETMTLIGQNLMDQAVLDIDKNTFEGLDKEFFRNVAVSSLAISGTAASQNIYSAVSQEFADRIEAKKEGKLRGQVLDIQRQLDKGGLTRKARNLLEKNKKKVLKELALDNTKKVLKISNLTAEEFENITETNRQLRSIQKEANSIGQSGDVSSWSNDELKRLKTEYDNLLSERAKVFDNKRQEVLDLFKGQTSNVVEAANTYGLYEFAKGVAKNQKGVNQLEFNNKNDLKKYLEEGNFSDELIKKITKGYDEGANAFNQVGSNDIILFKENIVKNIALSTTIGGRIAAMAPLHELGHIQTRQAGIIKDGEVAGDAVKMIEGINKKVSDLFNQKSITQDQYNAFKARISQYTDTNGKVDADELIQAVADFTNIGVLPKSAFNSVYEIKTYVNSVMKHINGDASMYFQLDTANDVFNFVSSWTGKAKEMIQLPAGEEDKTEEIKESKPKITPKAKEFIELNKEGVITNESLVDIINSPSSTSEDKFGAIEAVVEGNWPVISNAIKFNPTGSIPIDAVKTAVTEQIQGIFPGRNVPLFKGYNPDQGKVNTVIGTFLGPRQAEILERAKKIGGITQEGASIDSKEAKQTVDTSSEVDLDKKKEKPVKPKESLRESIPISDAVVQKVRDAVVKTFGTKLGSVENKQDFKEELRKAFRTELKTTIAKEVLGTRDSYETFLRDNFEAIYEAIPQEVINKRFKAFKEPVLDKNGKQLREKTAQGNAIFEKKKISKAEFIKNFLGREVGASTKGTRKDALAETLAEEFAFDATPETIQTESVETKRKFIDEKQSTKKVTEAIGRPIDLKFSLSEASQAKDVNASGKIAGIKGKITINDSNRVARQLEILKSIIESSIPTIIFEAGRFGNFGRWNRRGKIVKGIFIPIPKIGTKYFKTKDGTLIKENSKEYKKAVKDGNFLPGRGGLYYGVKDPAYIEARDAAKKNDKLYPNLKKPKRVNMINAFTEAGQAQSKANMDTLETMANVLAKAVADGTMTKENAALFIASSYQATTGLIKIAAPFKYRSKVFEYGLSGKQRKGDKYREEHNPPASVIGSNLIWAIANNKVSEIMPSIRKNFNQTQLSKKDDEKIDNAKLDATLPIGTTILDNPVTRIAASGINLNSIVNVETGKTLAEENGVGVETKFENNLEVYNKQNELILKLNSDKNFTVSQAKKQIDQFVKIAPSIVKASKSNNDKSAFKFSKAPTNKQTIETAATTDKALNIARDLDAPIKKIRVFDFDDTLAQTKSDVLFTMPDGTEGKLNAEQFASDGSTLLSEGAVFDFSEFNKVTEGKKGPLFKVAQTIAAKRGTEDVFVLTARAPESQLAIYEFLKSQGLDIPLKNITGLGNSTGEAKARWIVDKAADGYNDFYFADDAPQNVKAVKDALSVIDVKSKTQQAKIKFSKSLDLNKDFNDIIENKTGIGSDKTYSRVKAEVAGASKGKFNFFIPPSAEDFVGLLYSTLGKGDVGDAQMAWYKSHLLNPFARAMENLANDRANMMQDFRGLKKSLKIVPKNLRKKIKDSNFTKEQAVRAYIWDKQGMEIPGISQKDQKDLVDFVNADAELVVFGDQLIEIGKGDAYAAPDAGWVAGNIGTDFIKALNTTKRSKYLETWQQNVDQIFSEANLNKLEAAYGANYREAMVDMLKRMRTGRNTSSGSDRLAARFTDWLTNSVGAIMFFNTRSAVLQTISAVNFINFSDNNVLKAGAAFANQPQYWKDFKKLFNSPFLLDRRSGLKLNVNEADIAAMAKGPGNSARNVIAGILKAGFLPTQIADSFAIASGGASFYRNRIKALQKEGLTEAEAEEQAFRDFREIAEESQQSSRPDKISQQQAGPLGRVVLAFANTPAQYARLIKKAASDLKNGRGDAKTNISKIIYYGVAQNLLFSALQQALFAIAFDDEEEEEKKNEKYFNIINGMSDSILRGIGVGGAVVSVVKNTALRLAKEADKKSPKYQDAVVKGVLQISPPVSSKVGKLQSAGRSFSWNQEEMRTRGWSIDNPAYLASANVISAATNVPLDRAVKKITNVVDAGNEDIEYYKRVALALGWSAWELGIDKKGGKVTPPKTNMDKLYDLNKKEQIDSLLSLGLNKKQIKLLKKEEDRVKAILDPKSIKQIKVSKRDSLFGLNKKDQVKALEKLGLTKKEIRALRLESDRVEAIINKQKQEN